MRLDSWSETWFLGLRFLFQTEVSDFGLSERKWPTVSAPWEYPCNTHTRLTALCPGLPGWASTRKVKPIWILLEQETVSGSGISWAICKSASRSRQITTPAPHYSSFLQAGWPSCRPTNSVKALKAQSIHVTWQKFSSIFIPLPIQLIELEALCFWFVRLSCSYVCTCSDAFSILLAIDFWYPDIVYHFVLLHQLLVVLYIK